MRGQATVLAAVLLASPALAGGKDEAADLAGRLRGRLEAGVGDTSAPAKVPGYADRPAGDRASGRIVVLEREAAGGRPDPAGGRRRVVRQTRRRGRPDIAIKRGEAWLGAARRAEDKPEDQLGAMLSRAYEDCEATPGVAGGGGQTRYCDDYIETAERRVRRRRVVVVDRRHDYRCERRPDHPRPALRLRLRVEIEMERSWRHRTRLIADPVAPAVALLVAVASPSAARAAYCQATETACSAAAARSISTAARSATAWRRPSASSSAARPSGGSCRPRHVAWSRIVELATGRITHLAVDAPTSTTTISISSPGACGIGTPSAAAAGADGRRSNRYGIFGFRDGDGSATHLLLSRPPGRGSGQIVAIMNHRSTCRSCYCGHGYPSFGPGWLRIDKVVGYFPLPSRREETDLPRTATRTPNAPRQGHPGLLDAVVGRRAADKDGRCGAYVTSCRSRRPGASAAGVVDLGDSYTIARTRSTAAVRNRRRRRFAAAPARPASRARRPEPSAAFRYWTAGNGGAPVPTPARGLSTCDAWRSAVCAGAVLSPGPNGNCAHRETSYLRRGGRAP